MAVKIRLTRIGKKNAPHYRIVAAEEGKKRDGKYIERIGFYNPLTSPSTLTIDEKKFTQWIERGAQLSEGARKLLAKRLHKLNA